MAQRVQVLLVCDLHEDQTEGTETVAFALDGTSYEIDLCEQHAGELRDDLASYVGAARKAGRNSSRSTSGGRKASSNGAGGPNLTEVREWARSNGFEVSERGRVSTKVLDAYNEAH